MAWNPATYNTSDANFKLGSYGSKRWWNSENHNIHVNPPHSSPVTLSNVCSGKTLHKWSYTGYYMVARGYEFYVWVARTISHPFPALTREILFLPREHKIHIYKLMCNVNAFYYIDMLMTPFLMIFRRFLTTSWRFLKIFQNCSEGQTNISEHFPSISKHFPKITKDCWRQPKKIQRCFNHTPTNFKGNLKGQKWNHTCQDKNDMLTCGI